LLPKTPKPLSDTSQIIYSVNKNSFNHIFLII